MTSTRRPVRRPAEAPRAAPRARLPRLLVAMAGLVVLLAVGTAGPASAHARLVGTEPTNGTVLAEAPPDLRLTFNEPVAPVTTAFTLYDSTGRYGGGDGTFAVTSVDTLVTAALPASLPDGSYLLSWRVVSADAHPINGVLPFLAGSASAEPVAAPAADPESLRNPVNLAYLALQVLGYLGLLGAVGLVVFDRVVLRPAPGAPRAKSRLLALGLGVAVAAYGLLVGLTVVRERGSALTGLVDGSVWRQGLATSAAATLALAVAGGALLLLATRVPATAGLVVALAGALVAVSSVLPTGHTRTYGPTWLVVGLDLVHAATAAVWFGGLIGLGLHLVAARRTRSDPVPVAAVVARFSALAGGLVVLLGVSGVGLAVIIVGSFRALYQTDYGQALLVKVAVVAVIGLLAVWNRVHLVGSVRKRGAPEAQWRRLRGAVLDEAVLLVLTLAVTGLLTFQSPTVPDGPVPAGGTASTPAVQRVAFGPGTLQGAVRPGRVGPNTFEFTLEDATGAPLSTKEEPTVSASLAAENIGPLQPAVEQVTGTDRYRTDLQLPLAGTWVVEVSLPSRGFEPLQGRLEVPVSR